MWETKSRSKISFRKCQLGDPQSWELSPIPEKVILETQSRVVMTAREHTGIWTCAKLRQFSQSVLTYNTLFQIKCPWKCIIFGRRFVIDFVSIWAPFWKLEDRFGAFKIEYFWATGPRWSPRGLLDQFGVDLGLILEGFWEVLRRFLEGCGEMFGRTAVHRGDLRKC